MLGALIWLLCAAAVVLALSFFGGIAYFYSLTAVAALVVGGHLVTLDEDLKGGWSNPDGERSIAIRSLAELLLKLGVLLVLVGVLYTNPEAHQWGAA